MSSTPASSPTHSAQADPRLAVLLQCLSSVPELEFAVLVGSRAQGTDQPNSDWDIALQWHPQPDWIARLGEQESLHRQVAEILGTEDIDLIDLARANLAMRASVVEEGIVLKGEDTLAWARFLTRTWRELEDYYWESVHAA